MFQEEEVSRGSRENMTRTERAYEEAVHAKTLPKRLCTETSSSMSRESKCGRLFQGDGDVDGEIRDR